MTQGRHQAVAENIRVTMARKRISQRAIAAHLGISQPAMSARLSGRTPIDVGELLTIADALEVQPAQLLDGAA